MPPGRRWRSAALTAAIIVVSLYFLMNDQHTWNYGGYAPDASDQPGFDGKVHWRKLSEKYPVASVRSLPSGTPKEIPRVQATPPAESESVKTERLRRRAAVKASFVHSWEGYKAKAWMRDEVAPLSGGSKNTFGGWAATLVDSLDTLWIMGLKEDFELAVRAVEQIDFTTTDSEIINVFETTIRYMGGFLAAYDISEHKYPILLKKAVEVGELLMSCFDTQNRFPITRWDWKSYGRGKGQRPPVRMLVSEPGSLSLEFTRLAQLTGKNKYYDAIARIGDEFEKSQSSTRLPGLWPVTIDASKPSFTEDTFFTLGGMSDSLYEYLPKQYLLLGGLVEQPRTLYENFIEVAKKTMFFRIFNPKNLSLMVSGDIWTKGSGKNAILRQVPRGQHLTCFTGGMVGLASRIFNRPDDLKIAQELTAGCVWAYDSNPNGVAPELFNVMPCPEEPEPCVWSDKVWSDTILAAYPAPAKTSEEGIAAHMKEVIATKRLPLGFTSIEDRRYILRPEAIESVFMMWRLTGEQRWADDAWRMFSAIEKVSRTEVAAAAIADITMEGEELEKQKMDSMESFWLAETLKYFYLVFDEFDAVSLDRYVLNTEAHPLSRPTKSGK